MAKNVKEPRDLVSGKQGGGALNGEYTVCTLKHISFGSKRLNIQDSFVGMDVCKDILRYINNYDPFLFFFLHISKGIKNVHCDRTKAAL